MEYFGDVLSDSQIFNGSGSISIDSWRKEVLPRAGGFAALMGLRDRAEALADADGSAAGVQVPPHQCC
jgi:hypothetical protein